MNGVAAWLEQILYPITLVAGRSSSAMIIISLTLSTTYSAAVYVNCGLE